MVRTQAPGQDSGSRSGFRLMVRTQVHFNISSLKKVLVGIVL